jgi:glucose uptake protein GlcU
MFVLLVIVSTMRFYSFSEKKDGMEMIGGIVFGIMAIVYAGDLYGVIKNKKSINRGA